MIKIGTRASRLAVSQTKWVEQHLREKHPNSSFELVQLTTTGDQNMSAKFGEIGTKGIFTKELDDALLNGTIDLAVHSLKDLPSELPQGILLSAITGCVDGRDVVISRNGRKLDELAEESVVGTSSLRRQALVGKHFPQLNLAPLRGNLDTRLGRLRSGDYDAIILAAAGILRMGFEDQVTQYLDPNVFIPAIGQGMLAITSRDGDQEVKRIVNACNDSRKHVLAMAYRTFMAKVEGGCRVPMGCFATDGGDSLHMKCFVSMPDGSKYIEIEDQSDWEDSQVLAEKMADELLAQGGAEILSFLKKGFAV